LFCFFSVHVAREQIDGEVAANPWLSALDINDRRGDQQQAEDALRRVQLRYVIKFHYSHTWL
jgi:hypothetical protein